MIINSIYWKQSIRFQNCIIPNLIMANHLLNRIIESINIHVVHLPNCWHRCWSKHFSIETAFQCSDCENRFIYWELVIQLLPQKKTIHNARRQKIHRTFLHWSDIFMFVAASRIILKFFQNVLQFMTPCLSITADHP